MPSVSFPSPEETEIATSSSHSKSKNHSGFKQTSAVGKKKPQSRVDFVALLLLSVAVVIVFVAITAREEGRKKQATVSVVPTQDDIRHKMSERIEFHRQMTGVKLNQQRINVQFENARTAPSIPHESSLPRKSYDPVMAGLPLESEPHHRIEALKEPVNPDYADARVQYALEEEHAAAAWEREAQSQYVREFVRNAAAAGYKVQVDNKGRVIKVEVLERTPSSRGLFVVPAPSGSRGAR